MKIINKNTILLTALIGVLGTAQAERTPLQQKVLADIAAMQSMSVSERRDFRKNLFANMSSVEKTAYRQATKQTATLEGKVNVKATSASRVPGTSITYDTGTSTGAAIGTDTFIQGNRFDNAFNPLAGASGAINPVEATGNITNVTWMMDSVGTLNGGATTGVAFITLVSGLDGTPAQVDFDGFAPVPVGTLVSFAQTDWNYANGPFLAGIWQGNGAKGGVDAGTVNGQGFHGLEATSNGASVTSLGKANMIIRVSGNVLRDDVPVELMNFSID